MVTISIGKADTKCPEHVTLTSGMVNAVQVMFTFSDEWENFNKIAVFSNGDKTVDVSLDEDKCYIPHEVLAVPGNEVTVGVYGSKGEGDDYVAIPTEKCSLGEVVEGVDPSGEEPAEPTPSPWDDLQRRIKVIEDKMGNGGSADLGDIPERVEKLEEPANSYYEAVTVEQLQPESGLINGNEVSFDNSGIATIPHNGWINFSFRVPRTELSHFVVYVDDTVLSQSVTYAYSGRIKKGITVNYNGLNTLTTTITFRKLEILKFNGGIVSAEDYKHFAMAHDECENHGNNAENPHNVTAEQVGAYSKEETDFRIEDAIYRTFGTVEAVFDEVHEYAESLGGDEA